MDVVARCARFQTRASRKTGQVSRVFFFSAFSRECESMARLLARTTGGDGSGRGSRRTPSRGERRARLRSSRASRRASQMIDRVVKPRGLVPGRPAPRAGCRASPPFLSPPRTIGDAPASTRPRSNAAPPLGRLALTNSRPSARDPDPVEQRHGSARRAGL